MVALVPITAENWLAALAVRVQPERLPWVASIQPVALILLAKSRVRPDGQDWHPFVITDDDGQVVGIVGVGIDAADAPGGRQVAWLHHFLIDESAQGKGYGRAAMRAVGRMLVAEYPSVTRIGLGVLPDNEVAFGLYRSLGFEVVGITTDNQTITMAWVSEVAA